MPEFDLAALAAALDARRLELGLTWTELAIQATDRPGRRSERRISASTFKGIGQRSSVRDTVVLQALRWLGRTPESFVPGRGETSGRPVPDDETGRPALDTQAIYEALDARRLREGLTWRAVADRLGPGWHPLMLTRLAEGTGIGFPRVMRIFRWLDRPVADFVRFVPDEEG
ncbi:MAG TPA: hypothetical protein VKV06_14900 [Acidimicrobiales bacterium]|nr:hypothetical protein [Acidimicrobiales bacterium]